MKRARTSELPRLALPSGESEGYDHDAVDSDELAELRGHPAEAGSFSRSEPAGRTDGVPEPNLENIRESHGSVALEGASTARRSLDREGESGRESPDESLPPETVEHSRLRLTEGAPEIEDIDWSLATIEPVPDFPESAPELGVDSDAIIDFPQSRPCTDVDARTRERLTEDERCRQIAKSFLEEFAESTPENVDQLATIVRARGWSSAQSKVRDLYVAGYSIRAIFRAFELSEAWRDADGFDEFLGDYVGPRTRTEKYHSYLAWHEAGQLVEFFGEDEQLDGMLQFIESERRIWRDNEELRRQFPRFKNYLLHCRISLEFRVFGGGWVPALDPRDGRFFGGDVNPEYSSSWWEDEPASRLSVVSIESRIQRGADLGDFVEWPEDNLNLFGMED